MLGAPSCGHVLDRGVVHTHIDVGCALTARGEQVTSEFVAHVHRGKKIQKVMLLTTGRERHTHRRGPLRDSRDKRQTIGYPPGRRATAGAAPRCTRRPRARAGPRTQSLPERLVSETRALLSSRSSTRLKLRRSRRRRLGRARRLSPHPPSATTSARPSRHRLILGLRLCLPLRSRDRAGRASSVYARRARRSGVAKGTRSRAPEATRHSDRAAGSGIESSAAPLSDLVFERGACDAQAFEPIRVLLTHLRKCIRKAHPAAST